MINTQLYKAVEEAWHHLLENCEGMISGLFSGKNDSTIFRLNTDFKEKTQCLFHAEGPKIIHAWQRSLET